MRMPISDSTRNNWKRLGKDASSKLKSRANKQRSTKKILPSECLIHKENKEFVRMVVSYLSARKISIFDGVYSLALNLLTRANIHTQSNVIAVLREYSAHTDEFLRTVALPENERDILGIVYQSLLTEGQKIRSGSYYTPKSVSENMTNDLSFEGGKTLFDPCCGSGSFLLSTNAPPERLFGTDNDEIAVFVCKINLLLKYPRQNFIPQIICTDFLKQDAFKGTSLQGKKFDSIVTNPPWGATLKKKKHTAEESFSLFFMKSYSLINQGGSIRFLFPESVFTVKAHRNLRRFMMTHGSIESIALYGGMFSGVTTRFADIEWKDGNAKEFIPVTVNEKTFLANRKNFNATDELSFIFLRETDERIIDKIKRFGKYRLNQSVWGLGIVTGNNKKALTAQPTETSERIYTGKDILPYRLKGATNYIEYRRENFQQVAKEEIYRAKEKLVYKFIGSRLTFAYDDSRSLFLNSANILIPKIDGYSVKSVLAFLNSELFRYYYATLFPEIKILQGNLTQLPFPVLTGEQNEFFTNAVTRILKGDEQAEQEIQEEIFRIFSVTQEEREYIKKRIEK